MPTCNVEDCGEEAVATIVGENGYRPAYRCTACLCTDLGLREVSPS